MFYVFTESEVLMVQRHGMNLSEMTRNPLGQSLIDFWNVFSRYKRKDGQCLELPSDKEFHDAVRAVAAISECSADISADELKRQINKIFVDLLLSIESNLTSLSARSLANSLLLYVNNTDQDSMDSYSVSLGILNNQVVQVYDVTLRQRFGLEYYFTFFGAVPHSINRCPACHRWFQANHGNSVYCTPKCRKEIEKEKEHNFFYTTHRNKQKYYHGRLRDLLSACEFDEQNPLYLHCQSTYKDCLNCAQELCRKTIEYEKSRRGNEESLLLHKHFPYLPEVKSMPPTDHSKYEQDLKSIWGTFTAECKEAKKKCKKQ